MVEDNWLPLNEVRLEGVNQIHMDTRDFKCLVREDWISSLRMTYEYGLKPHIEDSTYTMSESDVLDFLKNIRSLARSRDDKWKPLVFEGVGNYFGLKYIRIYRIPDNPSRFIVCDRDVTPIEWRKCNRKNLK